jgi:steroid delta-isomerase-like uncharacterized protein
MQDPLSVVTAHNEAEHRQDIDAAMATFTERCHYFVAPLGLRLEGRDAIRDWYEQTFTGIPDYACSDERYWVHESEEETFVLYSATMHGTHLGTWHGWAPTGRRFSAPMLVRVPIAADGLMEAEEVYFDTASVFQQLGLLPPADGVTERLLKRVHAARVAIATRR